MFTSNCCFASNSVAACTCVSGPYRPKWYCWAPAVRCCPARPQQKWEECQKRGTPMASLGTSAPSTQTRFFYLKAICPEIHASRKFSSEDSEGSKLRVAIIIRLFNQGSDLEQSFKSSLPVLGIWLGLSGLGPDLGPWPWLGLLACITCFTLWRLTGPHIQRSGPSHLFALTHLFYLQPKCNCQIFFVMLHNQTN